MARSYAIEDIDARRREAGIEDVALHHAIADLAIGDEVRITLLSTMAPAVAETVTVRVTSVRADHYRGKLLRRPQRDTFRELAAESPLRFTAAHVHSICKSTRPKPAGQRPAHT